MCTQKGKNSDECAQNLGHCCTTNEGRGGDRGKEPNRRGAWGQGGSDGDEQPETKKKVIGFRRGKTGKEQLLKEASREPY